MQTVSCAIFIADVDFPFRIIFKPTLKTIIIKVSNKRNKQKGILKTSFSTKEHFDGCCHSEQNYIFHHYILMWTQP